MSFENKSAKEILISFFIYSFMMIFVFVGFIAYMIKGEPLGALPILLTFPYALWIDFRFELLFFKWKRIK